MWRSVVCLLSLLASNNCDAARILAVAPNYAVSHFRMVQPLFRQLANTGHDVTVLSFYPQPDSPPNYTDIDLASVLDPLTLNCEGWSLLNDIYDLFAYGTDSCATVLASAPVQKLLKSGQTFDLVILESFACDALLGFAAYYNAPYIAFSPMALTPWLADWVWDPVESSYVPDHMCREAEASSVGARGRRLACQELLRLASWWFNTRPSLGLVREHFGLDLDSLDELKANMSVMLVNTMPALGGIRPHLPNIIEVGGMHIKPPEPLPQELLEWMKKCSAGVVVFSMGSIVKASTLDEGVRDHMVASLGRLVECVLWKWEREIQHLPPNIKTVPWLPQSDVLAHPNTRVFITHGGFHGLAEAVHHGVPVVGIPLFGDQITNLELLRAEGAAEVLTLNPFHPQQFDAVLTKVLRNSSYTENMRHVSRLARDTDRTPLEKATWWTEYVLRHRGAPHLRHKGVNLAWWQHYMLDVFLAVVLSLGLLGVLLRASLKILLIF